MKKITSFMLSLVMAVTLMPVTLWADVTNEQAVVAEETTQDQDSNTIESTETENDEDDQDLNTVMSSEGEDGEIENAVNPDDEAGETDANALYSSAESIETDEVIESNASYGNANEEMVAQVGDTTYSTLIDAVNAAYELGSGQTITLLKNYEIETEIWTTYLLPDNSTLDLGGNTLTVPKGTAVFEGNNIVIQNGRFESSASYSIWIGNNEHETLATLKNITSNAGANVFAASAIIDGYSIDASNKEYYAAWADEGGDITINDGEFYGGENGVIGTASNGTGKITIYGGNFYFDRLVPGEASSNNIVIYEGTFQKEIDSKFIHESSNLVKVGNSYEAVPKDKIVENEDGSKTETTSEVNGNVSTVTETTTWTDAETGETVKDETVIKTDSEANTTQKAQSTTTTAVDESGTVTEIKTELKTVVNNDTEKEIEITVTNATVTKSADSTVTNETITVQNLETNITTETKNNVVATEKATTTEQTVTTTDSTGASTVATTKNITDSEYNVMVNTAVDKQSVTAKSTAQIIDTTAEIPSEVAFDATAVKVDLGSVRNAEITVPSDTVSALNQAAKADDGKVESVELKTDVATFNIDNTAIKTLTDTSEGAAAGNLIISIDRTDSTVGTTECATATYEVKASLDGTPVFKKDTAETNGNITIGILYTAASENNKPIVYYVNEDGTKTDMHAVYENGILAWTTNHFSTFEVVEKDTDLSSYTLTYDANAVYTGEAITPEVTVTNPEGIALTPETDYTVEYADNINAGAGKITVKGNGRYYGLIEGAFEIAKAEQNLAVEISSHEMLIGSVLKFSVLDAIGDITVTSDLEGIVSIDAVCANKIYALSGIGAGVVNVNVTAAGDDNHNSAVVTLCNIKVKPQASTIIDVANASDGITVIWNGAEGAQSYQLFRSEGGASMKYLKEIDGTGYLDTSAVAGKEYTYKVRAISRYSSSGATAYGEFSEDSESVVRLGTTAVTYSGNTKNGLTTKWTKVDGADGYYVYRIINGTDEAMVKYIDGDGECVYNDTSAELKDGDKVRYAVIPCVYNSEGEECLGQAAYGNVRFKVNAPTITGIVQGKHAGKKAIRVNWTKAAAESDAEGTVGYYVMRSVNGGSYTKVATVSTRGYYDYDVTSGNTYRYKVYAYKTNGKITARSIISNASAKIVKK